MHGFPKLRSALAMLVAIVLGTGLLAGCGSDDSSEGSPSGGYASKPADEPDGGDSGEVTPQAKKPASAGDKKKNAPDRAISKRPGGPQDTPSDP